MQLVKQFFVTFWELTMEMAPYLLLGFLIAGLLNGVFSKDWMYRRLGKPGLWSSIKASLLGIPLPLCSCGVIPTGVSFYKQGASKGATTSFLISTPQTGVDSILVTYSMMGWAFAIIRPIIAFITGVLGGFWADKENAKYVNFNDEKTSQFVNETDQSDEDKEHWFKRIFVYAFVEFMQDIARWLILGLVLATLITLFVPDELFTEYLNNPLLNILIILVASIPLYVCATASVPIAAALLLKGVSPGAALVFLMAGPATNIATMTVLWKTIGKKTTIIYLVSIIVGAIVFALIIDYILPKNWFTTFETTASMTGHEHHFLPHWFMVLSGILMLYLIFQAEILRFIPKKQIINSENMKNAVSYNIEGMTCNHCVANVDKNIKSLDGVTQVEVNLQQGELVVSGEVSMEKIKETIEALGYVFVGKK